MLRKLAMWLVAGAVVVLVLWPRYEITRYVALPEAQLVESVEYRFPQVSWNPLLDVEERHHMRDGTVSPWMTYEKAGAWRDDYWSDDWAGLDEVRRETLWRANAAGWYEMRGDDRWLVLGPEGRAAIFREDTRPHVLGYGTWDLRGDHIVVVLRRDLGDGLDFTREHRFRSTPRGRVGPLDSEWEWFFPLPPTWARDIAPDGSPPGWATHPDSHTRFEGYPWWTRVR